jgi:hypothetical protein
MRNLNPCRAVFKLPRKIFGTAPVNLTPHHSDDERIKRRQARREEAPLLHCTPIRGGGRLSLQKDAIHIQLAPDSSDASRLVTFERWAWGFLEGQMDWVETTIGSRSSVTEGGPGGTTP